MVNLRALFLAAGAFGASFLAAAVTHTEEIPKRAPYDAVRWEGRAPVVRIDDAWVTLVSINDVEVGEIVDYCRRTYAEKWRKRFEEDLVEVLLGMDHLPGERVRLVVRDADSAETRTLDEVAMTLANRQAIWWAAHARRERGEDPSVVSPAKAAE